MGHWAWDSIFYHVYPLGFCGAPERNDLHSPPVPRLEKLSGWLDHVQGLGFNALYLGPLFESSAHGYDTADYFRVDRRLGDNGILAALTAELHRRSMRVVLDGVFHHVGREFWAFRDLRDKGQGSAYREWFAGVSFGGQSPYGDPFTYQGWEGNQDLVKLELRNPRVREHLFEAVESWIREFRIDGLRLDVAYLLDLEFLRELGRLCRSLRPDFWLMGEVIHGDYRRWAAPGLLDAATNYECYKGLYSSHNDRNYFEIAYALNRQFGEGGMYRGLPLYAFADNHDVDRVASRLREPAHLFPLYCLLFTMPGVPSVYYGSEWGIRGRRSDHDDRPLRPALDLEEMQASPPEPELPALISRLARLRAATPALRRGGYRQLHVSHEQLAYLRGGCGGEGSGGGPDGEADGAALVAVNAAAQAARLELPVAGEWRDLLDPSECLEAEGGRLELEVAPRWVRLLARP
ncbi:MAG: hypothetical protein JW820_08665 [Spirochaetales bacterium]|nr:hypothetical protein [Spirochaetales bacterium]